MPNKTNHEKYYNYLFILFVIGFIALKFNDLFIPYFWDELGVYSQCAVYQYHHGISLMPASLPDNISRGHPLFLTVCNAFVMKAFGTDVYVPHSFHLFIAILLLLAVYIYTARYFNRLTGLVASVLLGVQPIFISQSILVLPEVLLSLLIFLSLVNYYEKKYWLFALFASLAILTKESAVVLPVAVFTFSLFRILLKQSTHEALRPINILCTFSPFAVFGIFLVIQKEQNGWYFFPYHIQGTGFNLMEAWDKFWDFFHFVFHRQARYWWKSVLIFAIISGIITNKLNTQNATRSILFLFTIFTACFLTFSSLSFFMERYVLIVLVLATITMACAIVSCTTNKYILFSIVSLLVVAALGRYETLEFNNDTDMGYRRHVTTLQNAINFCADKSEGKDLVYGNFPAYFAINFKEGGYLVKGKNMNATEKLNDSVRYFITSAPGNDFNAYEHFTDTLIAEFNDGYSKSKVYYITPRR